jgi:hypothetical protein
MDAFAIHVNQKVRAAGDPVYGWWSWPATPDAAGYRILRVENDPYFAPDPAVQPLWVTQSPSFYDPDAATQSVGVNHFYVVQALDAGGAVISAPVRRLGEFTFGLAPGNYGVKEARLCAKAWLLRPSATGFERFYNQIRTVKTLFLRYNANVTLGGYKLMKNFLSFTIFAALFLGLGALVLLAAPGGADFAPGSAVQIESQVDLALSTASLKYNVIALPLDSTQQFTDAGASYDADGLASIVGSGVVQTLKWNPNTQTYLFWDVDLEDGNNFALQTAGVYWLQLDNTATDIVSFVGDVPPQGSIQFNLVRPSSGGNCLLNDISIPLDRDDLSTAQELTDDVGNVSQALQWNASTQTFLLWDAELEDGNNFSVKIGYPYRLCLKTGGSSIWP